MHSATSSNITWDYISKISPAIPTLNYIGDHVDKSFGLIQGTRHADPSASTDLQVLRKSFRDAKTFQHDPSFHGNATELTCKDYSLRGWNELSNTQYLPNWWNDRKIYLAHRSEKQVFDPPSDSHAPTEAANIKDEVDLFAQFDEASGAELSLLDEMAQAMESGNADILEQLDLRRQSSSIYLN